MSGSRDGQSSNSREDLGREDLESDQLPDSAELKKEESEEESEEDKILNEELTRQLKNVPALKNDPYYVRSVGDLFSLPVFCGDDGSTRLPPPSYADLVQAMKSLEAYLQSADIPHDSVFTALMDWHSEIFHRMNNHTLSDSQIGNLMSQIHINLVMAQIVHAPESKISDVLKQECISNYLIDEAAILNDNISHWSGWNVAAGLGLIVLGSVFLAVMGFAIASSYGAALPLFLTAFNGEFLMGAVAYLAGYGYLKHRQLQREELRRTAQVELVSFSEENLELDDEEKAPTVTKKTASTAVIQRNLGDHIWENRYPPTLALVGSLFSALFMTQVDQSMASAALSLSPGVSTKATISAGSMNTGALGITASMLLLGSVGLHAIYQGFKMLKGEYDKAQEDKRAQAHSSAFFRTVRDEVRLPQPQVAASSAPKRLVGSPSSTTPSSRRNSR